MCVPVHVPDQKRNTEFGMMFHVFGFGLAEFKVLT